MTHRFIDPRTFRNVDCIESQNCAPPKIDTPSLACCLRVLVFFVVATGLFGFSGVIVLAGANMIDFKGDEPLATGSGALATRMAFDPLANTVVPTNEVGRHTQRMDEEIEHFFFEAEEMIATATYMNLEWVNTRTGYPELYPAGLSTEVPRPLATTAPFLSGTGVATILPGEGAGGIRKHLAIRQAGAYRLWVRYQSIRQLPAPFELVIEQAGEEVLRQRFNEESAALCRLAARLLWESTEPVELQPGEAIVRLVKVADENPGPLRGPRYVDSLLLTSDLDYIAGGGELLPSPDVMRARRDALVDDPNASILLWNRGRYEGFFGTSWPKAPGDKLHPAFDFELPQNAHANDLLLVSSCREEPLSFTTRLTLNDGEGRPFAGKAEVLVVGHMISRYFDHVPHVLLRRREITVAPYHTVGLWLQLGGKGAAPGSYSGALELLDGDEIIGRAPLSVEVFDRAVPSASDSGLHVLLWGRPFPGGYTEAETREMEERYWSNAMAHGWNTFFGQTPWSAGEARRRGVKAIIMSRIRTTRGLDIGSDEFKKELHEGLVQRFTEMRESGWNPHELWLEAFDEPSARSSERWLAYARVAKEAVPEAMMWTNPGWHVGQSANAFEAWAPYVDVWWPYASNLSQPDLLAAMKQSGKPIGFYIERGWSGFNPGAAWSYFRRMPMVAAKYGLMGCGFWSATEYYRDPWDDLNTRVNFSKAAVFYPGSQGPINTLNSAAWREGLDDLLMLRVLDEDGAIDAAEWAQKFLNVDSLTGQDALRRMLVERFVN